ncbi:M16 family metallopeptidase [Paenibacillus thermoaerophilus]|uniref:M16 family metallopeptidase n=1 Tax=Paenibacillus thermoaerophilus TaxID=1215385 RepID=A0ABW2V0V3_9BACL|nr:pitrilysin family protein [Paenibacillus thermoaerophilus]TMV13843.1 insulinase family protein [Paenibacillus thermoaerophilus]
MRKHVLRSGIRLVMENIPTCRSVSFGIWVKTGSRHEPASLNGVSHFIEHMLFKGTDRYSAKDIAEVFDGIGGNVNAFTSKEYTCYYAKVLDEHLPLAVDVLSDMFFRSRLDEEELAKERNVILEEISMYEDTPDDMVHDLIARAAFGDHPLGLTILGTEDNLLAMGQAELKAYIDQQYTSDRIVVSVAGNIDEEEVIALMERHFGDHPNTKGDIQAARPVFEGRILTHLKKTEQNHLCLSLPGCSLDDQDLYAAILVNNALGGGMSSRLFQEIREKRGLAYSVYSYHTGYTDSGVLTIYAGTAPKQTADVLEVTLGIMRDVVRNGLTDSELAKGKEQLKGSLILSLESTGSRMNRLGKNELLLGRHWTLDELLQRIQSVTQEQVRSVIDRLFTGPVAAALVGPSDDALKALGGTISLT